ncbi:MAG: response regulator [Clostridium sp.]|nr:response regulator [Clostridium sp.]
MKLLIADDEKIIRQGLMEVDWKSIGIEKVECVSSGTVALQIIAEDCPDVILADICMPGFSGLELAKFIDEKKYKCKVILLTGYEKFSYAKEAIRYHAFEYLMKPANVNEILHTVQRAIIQLQSEAGYQLYEQSQNEYKTVSEQQGNKIIQSIILFLEQNYMNDITLQQCAEYAHISAAYCSRLIKKETSYNFTFLLNMMRMIKAAELISQTEYRIFEICDKVGISDQRYFSKQFKKMFGKTPLEYRRSMADTKKISILDFVYSGNDDVRL